MGIFAWIIILLVALWVTIAGGFMGFMAKGFTDVRPALFFLWLILVGFLWWLAYVTAPFTVVMGV